MAESVNISANAKLNLSLDITGKRPDGYHTVEMVMQSVDISDTLNITKTDSQIEFNCNNDEIENDKIVTMRFIPSTDVQKLKIHAILCSCIGDDIKAALTGKNISVHTGYSGNADMAVKTFLGR